jgi:hypothetical protein
MNLWAEFDNEQLLAESAGRAQKQKSSQGRRLTEQAVLSSLRDWLLHDYVASYCRFLAATRIYRRCYWVDGLGANAPVNREAPVGTFNRDRGARMNSFELPYLTDDAVITEKSSKKGRKKDAEQGGQAVPPMLQPIASLSQELGQENRPITLHGIVLEAGSSKRKEGRVVEDEHAGKRAVFSLPKESGMVRASWLEVASTLLPFIDQSPAIFLLNPFGHTLFTYDDLVPLYTRTAPTELCLLISHKQLETRVIPSLRASVGVTLTALLRSDRWKALVSKGEEVEQVIDGIIDLFIASMQHHFLSVQRIALPVQVGPAVVETAPYTLIFATRRQDSLASMNDAVCLYRRRLYEQSSRGVLIEDWFARQQQERLDEQVQQLYSHTLQQGQSQRIRRWPDLRQQLLLANFGQFTLHDYDEVISKLLLNGEVRCEWRQRPASAGGVENRIPGNDDTLLWK